VNAAATTGGAGNGASSEPRHGMRVGVAWAVACVIAVPLVVLVLGPHIPPYGFSEQSRDQHDVNIVLTAAAVPVLLLIWIYFGYAVAVFRQRGPAIVDGPPDEGNARLQITWLVVTGVMVIGLAVFGTVDLLGPTHGAGGGQGPNPLAKPPDAAGALEVQVIGQQWNWTFRYPTYGGVETPHLALPANREIAFHVTSLDVIHSFWAIELGVKADAVPGSDNVAYVKPVRVGSFQVRCAELCGLWHGHMNDTGQVMTQAGFATWIAQQQQRYAGVTAKLPPYAHVYFPMPLRRAG
jgi:cytochrome c oxidase subunit II